MDAIDDVNQRRLPGAIVEYGVWSGGAFAIASRWDSRHGTVARNYHGFDSFQGLPPPTDKGRELKVAFGAASARTGRQLSGALEPTGICVGDNADSVRRTLARASVPQDRTFLHPGWFQNILPKTKASIGPIAILRIDGDWYDGTMIALLDCILRLHRQAGSSSMTMAHLAVAATL